MIGIITRSPRGRARRVVPMAFSVIRSAVGRQWRNWANVGLPERHAAIRTGSQSRIASKGSVLRGDMARGIGDVLDVVAGHFDVCVEDIRSPRRSRQVVPARNISAYLAERILGLTMQEIGNQLGGRDQTNIAMYCRTVARRADEDETFKRLLCDLEGAVRSRDRWS